MDTLLKIAPGTGGKSYLADVSTVKIEYTARYNSGNVTDTYNFIMFNINAASAPKIAGMSALRPMRQIAVWTTKTNLNGYYEFRDIPVEFSDRLVVYSGQQEGYKNSNITEIGQFNVSQTVTVNLKMQAIINHILPPGIVPDAPQNIYVSLCGDTFFVSWQAVDGADSYIIYYANNPDNILLANSKTVSSGNITSTTISNYDNSKQYYIEVKAYSNTGGLSASGKIVQPVIVNK